jgi:hypothetical protein
MNKIQFILFGFILVFVPYSYAQDNRASIFTPEKLSTETIIVNHGGMTTYHFKMRVVIIDSTIINSKNSFYLICEWSNRSRSIIAVDSVVNGLGNWYELYFYIGAPKGWMDVTLSRDASNSDMDLKSIPISNKLSVFIE